MLTRDPIGRVSIYIYLHEIIISHKRSYDVLMETFVSLKEDRSRLDR